MLPVDLHRIEIQVTKVPVIHSIRIVTPEATIVTNTPNVDHGTVHLLTVLNLRVDFCLGAIIKHSTEDSTDDHTQDYYEDDSNDKRLPSYRWHLTSSQPRTRWHHRG